MDGAKIERCYVCDTTTQPIYKFHINPLAEKRFYCFNHSPKCSFTYVPQPTRTIYE